MDLEKNFETISSREDLAAFVDALKNDLIQNPEDWENPNLERYLDALSAWIFSMEQLYINLDREVPIKPNWKSFAEMLLAAKIYE